MALVRARAWGVALGLSAAAWLLLVALAGASRAATVELDLPGGFNYQAGVGEANRVNFGFEGPPPSGTATVTDLGAPLTPGAGCAANGSNSVRCATMGLPRLTAQLGDDDDSALLDGPYFATVDGGPGADRVTATGIGPLTADGGEGNDVLTGGALRDSLSGGGGHDVLHGDRGDVLSDGDREGAVDSDVLDGGGRATADYSVRTRPLHIDLAHSTGNGERGEGDTLTEIRKVLGGTADDFLAGDGRPNAINGGGGADRILGRGGSDQIHIFGPGLADGGPGNDHIVIDGPGRAVCGPGRDHVQGGHSGAGPWLSSTCEVVGEQQDNFTYGVLPHPVRLSRRGRLVFRLPCFAGAYGSCKQRLSLTGARPPYRRVATVRLRRKAGTRRPALKLPAALARRARQGPVRLRVRLKGDDEANGWSFVWRFDVRLPK
jgi:Ca2+-binding RTX toxin-like protein